MKNNMNESLENRMLIYENVYKSVVQKNKPTIIRIDGKNFSRETRKWKCIKPFDQRLETAMVLVSSCLCDKIQNCYLAYTQSDEISLLLLDYKKVETQATFGGMRDKLASITASMATVIFQNFYRQTAIFDSRVFQIPQEEVANYFIWRQRDAFRNGILAQGRYAFGHKKIQGKKISELQTMLLEAGIKEKEKLGSMLLRGGEKKIFKITYDVLDKIINGYLTND